MNDQQVKELQRIKQLQTEKLAKLGGTAAFPDNGDYKVKYEDIAVQYKKLYAEYVKVKDKYKQISGRSKTKLKTMLDAQQKPHYESVMLQEALKDLERIRQ